MLGCSKFCSWKAAVEFCFGFKKFVFGHLLLKFDSTEVNSIEFWKHNAKCISYCKTNLAFLNDFLLHILHAFFPIHQLNLLMDIKKCLNLSLVSDYLAYHNIQFLVWFTSMLDLYVPYMKIHKSLCNYGEDQLLYCHCFAGLCFLQCSIQRCGPGALGFTVQCIPEPFSA